MDRMEYERLMIKLAFADWWGISLAQQIRSEIEYVHEAEREMHPYSLY